MAIDRPRPRGGPQHFQMANVGLNLSKMELWKWKKVLSNRMYNSAFLAPIPGAAFSRSSNVCDDKMCKTHLIAHGIAICDI